MHNLSGYNAHMYSEYVKNTKDFRNKSGFNQIMHSGYEVDIVGCLGIKVSGRPFLPRSKVYVPRSCV